MRRSLALKIGTLVLVVFTTTAPAFAAPRVDSPRDVIDGAIDRIVHQIRQIVHKVHIFDTLNVPH